MTSPNEHLIALVGVTYYARGGQCLEVTHWDDSERARSADLAWRDRVLAQLKAHPQ